jgi:tRNA(Phe) wybutosine-synthesizing methylase Tyw3
MHYVHVMAGDRRADAAEHAVRVNAAAGLLESGIPAAEAARVLAGRAGCSQRQARRYVSQAQESGRVTVPDEAASFTVRLPARLAAAVREHARASGRTVSSVAAQALEEFLARAHGGHQRR